MTSNRIGYGDVPGRYAATYVTTTPTPDGRALSGPWAVAPRTPRFVDMASGAPAPMDTTASILWDETALHIAFWAQEPDLTATMTDRDALLFFENDLEIFIDGGDSYYELEWNAAGTIYEVFYIWRDAYTKGSRWDQPRFDVHHPRVHSFGGDYTRDRHNFWTGAHPRGPRWAFLDYDLPGLQVQVALDGTLNDRVERRNYHPVGQPCRSGGGKVTAAAGRRNLGHLHGPVPADRRPFGRDHGGLGGTQVRCG